MSIFRDIWTLLLLSTASLHSPKKPDWKRFGFSCAMSRKVCRLGRLHVSYPSRTTPCQRTFPFYCAPAGLALEEMAAPLSIAPASTI